MRQYPWALNPQKLARAIGQSSTKSEEDIKREYLKIGGKVALQDIKETIMSEEIELTNANIANIASKEDVNLPDDEVPTEAPTAEIAPTEEPVVTTDDTSI